MIYGTGNVPIDYYSTLMTPQDTIDAFDISKLPSGPRILSRLISLVRKPDVELEDVAQLFRVDTALAARVVAACNSAYFAHGQRTSDIRDAVLHMGFREVERIVQIVMLTDFKKYPTHLYTQTAGHFWARSLHTALVCDEISGHDPSAYTAGIMHLVGVWILCGTFPAWPKTIEEHELALQAQLEQLRLGVNFAYAGGGALARWGFEPPVCNAVLSQLTPSLVADPAHFGLARVLNRAVAITDWHYGGQNEGNLIRSDLTITDVQECNERAAARVAKIALGA
jgi:HD-like signal output (HDOD) protein